MTDKDAKFYTNSGIEKTNHGDFEGAIRDFEKAEELLPDWALTHFSKAIAYHHLKQLEKAFESYTRAIELDGKMVDAYYNRAHAVLLFDNLEEKGLKQALSDLQKAIELDEKFVDALYYSAVVKMKLKDYQGAVNDLDNVIAIEPAAIHSKALKKLILQKYMKQEK